MTDLNTTAGAVGAPPSHYQGAGMQVFDVIDAFALNFFDGNAFKYLARWQSKGSPLNDLRKALHYIQEAILRIDTSLHVIPDTTLTDAEVASAFGLTGYVASAVGYLLNHEHCDDPGGSLMVAARYVEMAIGEAERS